MGHASRLFIKEIEVKVVFISDEAMPIEIQTLDCLWKSGEDVSKLLGFYVGEDISANLSKRHLEKILDKRLHDARLNPYSIPIKVALANQMINSALFYTIQLWPRDIRVWSGSTRRSNILYGMSKRIQKGVSRICSPAAAQGLGGFGLILSKAQFFAMAAILVLWKTTNGECTLCNIIRFCVWIFIESKGRSEGFFMACIQARL